MACRWPALIPKDPQTKLMVILRLEERDWANAAGLSAAWLTAADRAAVLIKFLRFMKRGGAGGANEELGIRNEELGREGKG